MNCPKCGLPIGHGTMGTVLPLCQCSFISRSPDAQGPSQLDILQQQLAASEQARQKAEAELAQERISKDTNQEQSL
jgi:uncharacterized Zn finger protein (UPF0148 family)